MSDDTAETEPLIRVTVAEALGSTPREAGAVMLVEADRITGTIGGGALEFRAIAMAREMLADGRRAAELRLPLGPALNQCCGGYVVLRLEASSNRSLDSYPHRDAVMLYGAGHVGQAVVAALAPLPFTVTWVDQRADAFPPTMPDTHAPDSDAPDSDAPDTFTPDTCTIVIGDPRASAAAAPAGALHLIMTHDHGLDLELCATVLAGGDAAYVGLIGSRSKRVRFERQLRARGLTDDAIARLVCPIGIAGITGKQPAVIAAATAAELLLVASRRAAAAEQAHAHAQTTASPIVETVDA